MNKKLKYILIIAIIIIVIVVVFNYFSSSSASSQEDALKKSEIDDTFAIWQNIAPSGDKKTLVQNEISIKKDLYDKLNSTEITSLKQYSISLQNLLSVKNKPFDPLFLSSLAYLTSNFDAIKQVIAKTSASNILPSFILGPIPQSNYSNTIS